MELPDYLIGVPEEGSSARFVKLEINGIVYGGYCANLFWRTTTSVAFDLVDALDRPVMRNVCPQVDTVVQLNQSPKE